MTDLLTENARLRAALEKALNYIENTESELGITLDCGDAARAALATPAPDAVMEAGVYTARGIGDLQQLVCNLSQQGFRIIAVIDTQNGDYHVVAQREGR